MKTWSCEKRKRNKRNADGGFMLLEVLVSILLFALGIVALVGLQGRSLMVTDDVQYRAEAIHLANAYVGKMWASGLAGPALQTAFRTGGAQYNATLLPQVMGSTGGFPGIPGAQAPQVVITDNSLNATNLTNGALVPINSVNVQITISWVDREGVPHSYVQDSSIGY